MFSIKNKWLIIFYSLSPIDLWATDNFKNSYQIKFTDEINKQISTCEFSQDEDYIMIANLSSKLYYI